MKKLLWTALIPAAVLFSCNSNTESDKTVADSTGISADTTSRMSTPVENNKMADNAAATGKTITDKDVIDFVENTASVGTMEVELGNYAVQNAKSQRVKDFGSMMVTDHTAAANELKSMATSNSITVPAAMKEDQQHHVDMLKKKTGASFDKGYIDMMVKGHKGIIDNFQKASKDLKEDSYKTFAGKTLPVLQKHLDSAQAIRKSL